MRISDFEKNDEKDKVELVKQQVAEIQRVLNFRITPHGNHLLFEVDLKKGTIKLAEYAPPRTIIYWHEALALYYNKVFKKINIFNAEKITKAEVMQKENCLYISALNKSNVIKILKRDFNIKFKQ
jgi:hypothetical protein